MNASAQRVALPRLWLTTGEPAGIGPDIVLSLADAPLAAELVLVADPALLRTRAQQLGISVELEEWTPDCTAAPRTGRLWVRPVALRTPAIPGQLDVRNASYVLETLQAALDACRTGTADAIVTAPVQKSIIADSGVAFTGHTEFFADGCGGLQPVMMLLTGALRVALVTTHLPLRAVPDAITTERVLHTLQIVDHDLRTRFGIAKPALHVCGLNPHAGEGGHLGHEDADLIAPAIATARAAGIAASGPFPADTALTPERWAACDAVVAMYHDQGLPALKYAGFGHAVNVTLGLPIIRTSVDHGTALDLAGSGRASAGSLHAAVELAAEMVRHHRAVA
ncbi:MAG: 4-hydroxythreonine-4-phosphate dehydrogenase PdxA [Nevskiaceae bacterium]|nr:MAG: 4-hydroxythreonine-4-phosphate dehydrogenase PdxA [Nevskiaceae bacterium]TBR71545.1 MAG: 4-hydroxythreonine-4-phosphate dehydrogenase PdxA [Nevskiaceae bacterium]